MNKLLKLKEILDHQRELWFDPRGIEIDPTPEHFVRMTPTLDNVFGPYRWDAERQVLLIWSEHWKELRAEIAEFFIPASKHWDLTDTASFRLWGIPVRPYTPPSIVRGEE